MRYGVCILRNCEWVDAEFWLLLKKIILYSEVKITPKIKLIY